MTKSGWWKSSVVDVGLCVGIVGVAMGLRVAYMLQVRTFPMFERLIVDGQQYSLWADRILAGHWLGDQVFYQAPLYPYFLAVLKLLVGNDLWAIRLVQVALGALSCGLVFMAGRLAFGRAAGVLAGLGLALYAPAIFYDTLIQKAGIGLLWMSLLLVGLALLARRATSWRCAALGTALGLMMLTREETILLVPVLGAIVWLAAEPRERIGARVRRRAGMLALFAAGLTLPLLPVAVRNLRVGGEFVLTTSQAGSNFYIGNNPAATGTYLPLRAGRSDTPWEGYDARDLAEKALGRRLSSGEVSRYWFGLAWQFIRSQPGTWARLIGRKAALLVNWYEVPDAEDLYHFETRSALLGGLERLWNLGLLLPLGVAGIVLTAGRRRGAWAMAGVLAILSIGVVLFFVFGRYRYPIVPVLMIFAGAALTEAGPLLRARSYRRPVLALVACAALGRAASVTINPRDGQQASWYMNSGSVLMEAGRSAEAVDQFKQAAAVRPDMWEMWANLGLAYSATGKHEAAIQAIQAALKSSPDNAVAHFYMGLVLEAAGRDVEAVHYLTRSLALYPDDPDATAALEKAKRRLGPSGYRGALLSSAVKNSPHDPEAIRELVWFLATCPDAPWRSGPGAVNLATGAQLNRSTDPRMLDAAAAAFACAGRFPEAVATARGAEKAAMLVNQAGLAADIRQRRALYEQERAWVQPER